MSATRLLWEAMGKPLIDGCSALCIESRCYVCGDMTSYAQPVTSWMGGNYTDQTRIACPTSPVVCAACAMVTQRTFPVPGRPAKEGKSAGGNFRNYSHLYDSEWDAPAFGDDGSKGGHYANASKGQKPLIREFLGADHAGTWFCSIADSGQKHVIHFAPVNGPGRAGMVIFEERIFWWDGDMSLLAAMIEMLTLGATKDELSSGAYRSTTWRTMRAAVDSFEQRYSGERGGDKFTLCVWLAQRDEEKCNGNKRKDRERPSRNDPGPAQRLPEGRSKSDGPLDTVGEPVPCSSNAVRDNQRVVQRGAKEAANPEPQQGQLSFLDCT